LDNQILISTVTHGTVLTRTCHNHTHGIFMMSTATIDLYASVGIDLKELGSVVEMFEILHRD